MMNIQSVVIQSRNELCSFFFLRSYLYTYILKLNFEIMKKLFLSLFFVFSCGFSFAENFSSQTIDLGVVVTDIDKSLEFYKNVVGFTGKDGFEVRGDFPKKVGLTDGTPLKIHVLPWEMKKKPQNLN